MPFTLAVFALYLATGSEPPASAPYAVTPSAAAIPEYPGYRLVWHDEFNLDGSPDPTNWVAESGFVRNRELQWYQLENARCEGGRLILEAKREQKANAGLDAAAPASDWKRSRPRAEYTSASIKTRGKHEWTYGRWEMRGRIDIRPGLWPAFWTVGVGREWPGCGEIDIMEYFRGLILANCAWGSSKRWSAVWDDVKLPIEGIAKDAGYDSPQAWAADFHVWRMEWDATRIRHFLDGRLLNEIELSKTINGEPSWPGGVGGGINPFREPHHIILNLAIGGTEGGDPAATEFPARFEVDWVRVYQPADAPPKQDAPESPPQPR